MTVGPGADVAATRLRLVEHELYPRLGSLGALRIFMKHHVFAVWDFFSLLKRLQRTVTTVDIPWQPPANGVYAHLINSIVVAEESDVDGRGGYASHFELYLDAMEEAGADTGPIDRYRERLLAGADPIAALRAAGVPAGVEQFVAHTLATALDGEDHEVAASFCCAREDVIPDLLTPVMESVRACGAELPRLAHYLERLIALDHAEHGPLAQQLLEAICDSERLRAEADRAAVAALERRIALWDGVLAEIEASGA